ncbi:ArsI/CadI family heavy metal resistance metalloenzyme [Dokdonella sp.]|uniref:ArsI/CadI family heavy metal resistance metalloenzyme n=1 Tax=Dokdonella sp. TaxID=2291710 RepID=UPI003783372F
MKRFHVHVNVTDLDASIAFYSQLFAATPTRVEADYAKWMLEDPRINFAISRRERAPGVDHLGFQVESGDELAEIGARLAAADAIRATDVDTTCCYARSDKYWSEDPQGLRWESFLTHGSAPTYFAPSDAAACCVPAAAVAAAAPCCGPSASAASRCG